MWVFAVAVQFGFNLVPHFAVEEVLDPVGSLVQMVAGQREVLRHVRLPQPVRTHKLLCNAPSGIGEHAILAGHFNVALLRQSPQGEAVEESAEQALANFECRNRIAARDADGIVAACEFLEPVKDAEHVLADDSKPDQAAADGLRDQSFLRAEQEGGQEDATAGDGRHAGRVGVVDRREAQRLKNQMRCRDRQPVAEKRASTRHQQSCRDHRPEPLGQQKRGRGRSHQDSDDQNAADALERRNQSDRRHCHQHVVDDGRIEARTVRQSRVERRQTQLFEAQQKEHQVQQKHAAVDDRRARHVAARQGVQCGRRFDGSEQDAVRIQMHVAGVSRNQKQAEREQRRVDHSQRGRTFDSAQRANRLGEQRSEDSRDDGSAEHEDRRDALALLNPARSLQPVMEEECRDDSRQSGMAECVAQHALFSQDEEHARQCARHRGQSRRDGDPGVDFSPLNSCDDQSHCGFPTRPAESS